ncbi:MAG: ABC transporter permease [Bacteroidetes bacterium]|jgi:lipoprotein-releasing system permease protein|nr:ABC transporter permease [Bacteroidota bacterium]
MARFFFERLISSRMLNQADASGRMSKPIVRVAVGGISLGLAVMILTLAVMNGFQKSIREKVIGFGSHIQISGFDTNQSFETDSMNRNQPTVEAVKKLPGIRHVQVFATKSGIIKSGDQLMGVVLKGVDKDFDWNFFKTNLKEGKIFSLADTVGDGVLVSRFIANKMNLKIGKKFRMFFLRGNETRQRAFRVSGIYETGLTDGFDDMFLLCDIRQVQKLNDWDTNLVAGYEVLVDNYESLDKATQEVLNTIDVNLNAQSIKELTPQIFSWLDVLDVNALIIIVLMLFVSMINMISALIILILDRTNMIGTLKALGASDKSVIRIFLIHASKLILFGLVLGNILGLGMCWLQDHFGFVHLDEASYYVKTVPIYINWTSLIILNVATLFLCEIALLLPALIVTRISPVKAIRFS